MGTKKINVAENVKSYIAVGSMWNSVFLTRSFYAYCTRIFWGNSELANDLDEAIRITDYVAKKQQIDDFLVNELRPLTPVEGTTSEVARKQALNNTNKKINKILSELSTFFKGNLSTDEEVLKHAYDIINDIDKQTSINVETKNRLINNVKFICNYRLEELAFTTDKPYREVIADINATIKIEINKSITRLNPENRKARILLKIKDYLDGSCDIKQLTDFIKNVDPWGFEKFFSFHISRSLNVIMELEKNQAYRNTPRHKGHTGMETMLRTTHEHELNEFHGKIQQLEGERDILLDREAKRDAAGRLRRDALANPMLAVNEPDEFIEGLWNDSKIPQPLFIQEMGAMLEEVSETAKRFNKKIEDAKSSDKRDYSETELHNAQKRVNFLVDEIMSFIQERKESATNPKEDYQTKCADIQKYLNMLYRESVEIENIDRNVTAYEQQFRNVELPRLIRMLSSMVRMPTPPVKHMSSASHVTKAIDYLIAQNQKRKVHLSKTAKRFKDIGQYKLANEISEFIHHEVAERESRLNEWRKEVQKFPQKEFNVLADLSDMKPWERGLLDIVKEIRELGNDMESKENSLFNYTGMSNSVLQTTEEQDDFYFKPDEEKPRIFVPGSTESDKYSLELISSLGSGQPKLGVVYVSEDGTFIVKDSENPRIIHQGQLTGIDLTNLATRLKDHSLLFQVLASTTAQGYTRPSITIEEFRQRYESIHMTMQASSNIGDLDREVSIKLDNIVLNKTTDEHFVSSLDRTNFQNFSRELTELYSTLSEEDKDNWKAFNSEMYKLFTRPPVSNIKEMDKRFEHWDGISLPAVSVSEQLTGPGRHSMYHHPTVINNEIPSVLNEYDSDEDFDPHLTEQSKSIRRE